MNNLKIRGALLLIIVAVLCTYTALDFMSMWDKDVLKPSESLTEIKMLSDYYPDLKGTAGDTEIYVFEGEKEGGSILILGGTHANEFAAYMAGITMLENADVAKGTLYVIPRTNNSAFSHNDAQEGSVHGVTLGTKSGDRWFTFGSRASNPIHSWPDPDVYIHASSGQKLSGSETRNINRAYPGRTDGSFTEKVAFGITEFIKAENIDITVDMHEASPEYPVINATVAHETSMPLASIAMINLQLEGIDMGLEPSPINLHGLTHRELGDYTDTLPLLMETANAAQGRLRGAMTEELVIDGIDKMYVKAAQEGRLFVDFDDNGHPLEDRVGRHISGILAFTEVYTEMYPDNGIIIEGVPRLADLMEKGIQSFLN